MNKLTRTITLMALLLSVMTESQANLPCNPNSPLTPQTFIQHAVQAWSNSGLSNVNFSWLDSQPPIYLNGSWSANNVVTNNSFSFTTYIIQNNKVIEERTGSSLALTHCRVARGLD